MGRERALEVWKSRTWTVPVALAFTGALSAAAIAAARLEGRDSTQHRLMQWWARRLFRFVGVRLQVTGLEHISGSGPYIVASNHASLMDIPTLAAALPLYLRYMAKRELFRVPFLTGYMKAVGHPPIDRHDPRSALRGLHAAADAVRARAMNLVVFPEGTRSLEGVGTFKDGAAVIAIRAGAPLLPVAIHGTNHVLRSRSSLLRGGDVRVCVGQPIETAGLTAKARQSVTEELERRVRELYAQAAGISVPLLSHPR